MVRGFNLNKGSRLSLAVFKISRNLAYSGSTNPPERRTHALGRSEAKAYLVEVQIALYELLKHMQPTRFNCVFGKFGYPDPCGPNIQEIPEILRWPFENSRHAFKVELFLSGRSKSYITCLTANPQIETVQSLLCCCFSPLLKIMNTRMYSRPNTAKGSTGLPATVTVAPIHAQIPACVGTNAGADVGATESRACLHYCHRKTFQTWQIVKLIGAIQDGIAEPGDVLAVYYEGAGPGLQTGETSCIRQRGLPDPRLRKSWHRFRGGSASWPSDADWVWPEVAWDLEDSRRSW
ncbi:hypothetical protein C8J57DRAFT_1247390 [Mycena rebaudengoi]|nr:hypothetical protein C8J57DRAFT_1247390 [Mycena rebaudengoi]